MDADPGSWVHQELNYYRLTSQGPKYQACALVVGARLPTMTQAADQLELSHAGAFRIKVAVFTQLRSRQGTQFAEALYVYGRQWQLCRANQSILQPQCT
jgi:hypothetical protein